MKIRLSLAYVKPVCVVATLLGIVGLVSGNLITGLCFLLGAYIFEKNMYRCPGCKRTLNMKLPLHKGAHCPDCGASLR